MSFEASTKVAGLTTIPGIVNIEGDFYIKLPLDPKEINTLLKKFDTDDLRIQAIDGICQCGSVKNGSTCWGCYESYYDPN